MIEQTDSLSLLTDGERRYGNILFEICHEVIRNGNPGRPLNDCPKELEFALKTKAPKASGATTLFEFISQIKLFRCSRCRLGIVETGISWSQLLTMRYAI